eukprot:9039253-Lingulodinium_polyedra.AAC.1
MASRRRGCAMGPPLILVGRSWPSLAATSSYVLQAFKTLLFEGPTDTLSTACAGPGFGVGDRGWPREAGSGVSRPET